MSLLQRLQEIQGKKGRIRLSRMHRHSTANSEPEPPQEDSFSDEIHAQLIAEMQEQLEEQLEEAQELTKLAYLTRRSKKLR